MAPGNGAADAWAPSWCFLCCTGCWAMWGATDLVYPCFGGGANGQRLFVLDKGYNSEVAGAEACRQAKAYGAGAGRQYCKPAYDIDMINMLSLVLSFFNLGIGMALHK